MSRMISPVNRGRALQPQHRLGRTKADLAYPQVAVKLYEDSRGGSGVFADANEAVFGALELEEVMALVSRIEYPELKAKRLIPVTSEGGEGAETIAYREWDRTGIAKFIANGASDIPIVNLRGKKYRLDVHVMALGFEYSVFDIAKAAKANIPLLTELAEATREGIEMFIDQTAWLGDLTTGRVGFFYSKNITVSHVPTGVGGYYWTQKTPDEILYDLNLLVAQPRALTKGIAKINQVLLPITEYDLAASTPRASGDGRTILEVFKASHPGLEVEDLTYLSSTELPTNPLDGSSAVDCMVAYAKNPAAVQLSIPSPYKAYPAREKGAFGWYVPTKAHYGDVIFRQPLKVNMFTGIGVGG